MHAFDPSEVTLHLPSDAAEAAALDAFAAGARDALAGFGSEDPVTGRLAYPAIARGRDGHGIVHYEGAALRYSVAVDSDGNPALDDDGNPRRQYFRYDAHEVLRPLPAGRDDIHAAAAGAALLPAMRTQTPEAAHGKHYDGVQTLQPDAPILGGPARVPESIAALLGRGVRLDEVALAAFARHTREDGFAQLGQRAGGTGIGIA